jgi:hypothetical protein
LAIWVSSTLSPSARKKPFLSARKNPMSLAMPADATFTVLLVCATDASA